MRIPTDISLSTYIRRLIKQNHIERFYLTDDWKEMRKDVIEENHNECFKCKERGKITTAECVHHVLHVKDRPDLALSKYYTDAEGMKHIQLMPLCNACHNIEHPEKLQRKETERFTNKERW